MLAFRFRDQADPAGHESSVALPAGSAQCAHPEMHPPQHHLCVVSSVLPHGVHRSFSACCWAKFFDRIGWSQSAFTSQAPCVNPSSHLVAARANSWPPLDPWLSLQSRPLTSCWWIFCLLQHRSTIVPASLFQGISM